MDTGNAYLKHRTYVDNVSSVFPEMKSNYNGKYIELDFSQNLDLRPKVEVQSAHFSGKQFTLHCSIVNPVNNRYHFHLSDDTNHGGVFVDHVIRDIIAKYDIQTEDLWIQSDNASSQYKNKYSFTLLKKLASEFNLRIIRTYGAAGHGKGAIDGMSSFGVKNVLRKDIVTHNVFFNKSEEVVEYLQIKCPQFSYTHLPSNEVVKSRIENSESLIIKDCMKQHLMVFTANEPVICKDYLCSCTSCLEFNFQECSGDDAPRYSELSSLDYYGDDDDEGDVADKREHILDFIEVPSFASLFSGSQNEPLYFVKVTEKGTAEKYLTDPYGHFIGTGEKFLKGYYLKQCRSKQISKKKFQILPTPIVFAPDEVFDTYVDITDDLYFDVQSF